MGLYDLFKRKYRLHDKIKDSVPDDIKKDVDEALAEMKLGNYIAAINIFNKIIPDYPDIGVLRNNLGCCFASIEKFEEAETEFIEAIRISKLNRYTGIRVPRSYLKKPNRNLIKLYKTVVAKKHK